MKFDTWLKNHGCDTEELWKIQSCLGNLYGFDSEHAKEASKAWEESRKDPANCRHLWEQLGANHSRCVRCNMEEKPEEKGECEHTNTVLKDGESLEAKPHCKHPHSWNDPYATTYCDCVEKANQGGCDHFHVRLVTGCGVWKCSKCLVEFWPNNNPSQNVQINPDGSVGAVPQKPSEEKLPSDASFVDLVVEEKHDEEEREFRKELIACLRKAHLQALKMDKPNCWTTAFDPLEKFL